MKTEIDLDELTPITLAFLYEDVGDEKLKELIYEIGSKNWHDEFTMRVESYCNLSATIWKRNR